MNLSLFVNLFFTYAFFYFQHSKCSFDVNNEVYVNNIFFNENFYPYCIAKSNASYSCSRQTNNRQCKESLEKQIEYHEKSYALGLGLKNLMCFNNNTKENEQNCEEQAVILQKNIILKKNNKKNYNDFSGLLNHIINNNVDINTIDTLVNDFYKIKNEAVNCLYFFWDNRQFKYKFNSFKDDSLLADAYQKISELITKHNEIVKILNYDFVNKQNKNYYYLKQKIFDDTTMYKMRDFFENNVSFDKAYIYNNNQCFKQQQEYFINEYLVAQIHTIAAAIKIYKLYKDNKVSISQFSKDQNSLLLENIAHPAVMQNDNKNNFVANSFVVGHANNKNNLELKNHIIIGPIGSGKSIYEQSLIFNLHTSKYLGFCFGSNPQCIIPQDLKVIFNMYPKYASIQNGCSMGTSQHLMFDQDMNKINKQIKKNKPVFYISDEFLNASSIDSLMHNYNTKLLPTLLNNNGCFSLISSHSKQFVLEYFPQFENKHVNQNTILIGGKKVFASVIKNDRYKIPQVGCLYMKIFKNKNNKNYQFKHTYKVYDSFKDDFDQEENWWLFDFDAAIQYEENQIERMKSSKWHIEDEQNYKKVKSFI